MSTLEERNAKVIASLAAINNEFLYGEVEYYLSIAKDDGSPANYYDALTQAYDYAQHSGDRTIVVAARRALIHLGVYREITRQELASAMCLRNGRQDVARCDFRFKGNMYVFDKHI